METEYKGNSPAPTLCCEVFLKERGDLGFLHDLPIFKYWQPVHFFFFLTLHEWAKPLGRGMESQVQDASVTALGTDLLILWSYSPERLSSSLVITQLPGATLELEPSGFTGKPPW